MPRLRILIPLAIVSVLSGICLEVFYPRIWIGFYGEQPNRPIGKEYSLDACRKQVEKVGGWCGKNCTEYASGLYKNCNPRVPISKAK